MILHFGSYYYISVQTSACDLEILYIGLPFYVLLIKLVSSHGNSKVEYVYEKLYPHIVDKLMAITVTFVEFGVFFFLVKEMT